MVLCTENALENALLSKPHKGQGKSTISCHVRPPVADDSSPMTCTYGKNLDRLGIHSKSSKAQLEFSKGCDCHSDKGGIEAVSS